MPRSTRHRLSRSTSSQSVQSVSHASPPTEGVHNLNPTDNPQDDADGTLDLDNHLNVGIQPEENTNANRCPQPSLLEFSVPLTDGSSMSKGDAMVLVTDYALKHALSWTAIEDLLKLLNKILQKDALPESKHLFKKFSGVTQKEMKFHFYCPACQSYLQGTGGTVLERNGIKPYCSLCKKQYCGPELMLNGSFFVSLPVEKQLSSLLTDDTFSVQLYQRLEDIHASPTGDLLSDVTDGTLYKEQRAKLGCSKYDFTLTMNSDGSPAFKSAKYSIWPVQLIVNELPPRMRWTSVIVPLLWYGNTPPNMMLLLQAFATQMSKLAESGVQWSAGNIHITSRVFCISSVADSPAKAAMQNMLQFNGYYGCGWCLHPGKAIEGTVKYPLLTEPVQDRTEDETIANMTAAAASRRTVQGFKGPSPLLNVPGFNIVWGFQPDYMHCVLLGVVRQITDLWFTAVGEEYYVGTPTNLRTIDGRLCGIKPPKCFTRLPRSVSVRKYWKAVGGRHGFCIIVFPVFKGFSPVHICVILVF